ncbi:MAG: hypothetical protein ACLQBL_14555 [Polyangiaceae bacterium]
MVKSTPGVAPSVLAAQVAATAPWIVDADAPACAIVRDVESIEAKWRADALASDYFGLLLAAHYLTVATFVPTDVDARIRHHAWVEADRDRLASQLDRVDAAASWDARLVSARTVADPRARSPEEGHAISGHDGEWLSVWAGALGRALVIEDDVSRDRCLAAIEASLDRQAGVYLALEGRPDRLADLLRAGTVLAHNAGDLSRVVEQWPKGPSIEPHRARLMKLGHERGDRFGGAFMRAGAINKALTAIENHRFLALRAPRGLRRARALLLPIGPFFDDWGEAVARSTLLEHEDRAAIVEALLETHLRGDDQQGCLRALAAIHEHAPGGLDRLAPDLPARMRKLVSAGVVREAMKTSKATFEGRYLARAKGLVAGMRR